MNLRSRSIAALAVAVVSLVAMQARAQQRALDLTRFVPPLDAEGFLGVQSTAAPGAGRANTVLTLDYAWRPLVVTTADGRVVPIIEDRLTADVGIQVGIGGRLALGLAVPLVLWQSTNGRALDGQPLPSVAAGDPRLSARYRIVGESASVARERLEGPGLALAITGWLPAGQTDAFLGEGALRLAAQVLADFQVLGAGVGGVLGFRHRFERRYLLGERYSSELELGLALKLPIPVMRDFSGLLELHAITDAMKPFGAANTSVETSLGCRIVLDDLAFTGSIGLGLTGGVGTPAVRSTLAVAWAPRTHDRDTDTVPDDSDECPPLPEDFDGFEDEDGCPDPDNDDDMVLDQDDQCPTETAVEGRDEDEDGCTDPFVDAAGTASRTRATPARRRPKTATSTTTTTAVRTSTTTRTESRTQAIAASRKPRIATASRTPTAARIRTTTATGSATPTIAARASARIATVTTTRTAARTSTTTPTECRTRATRASRHRRR